MALLFTAIAASIGSLRAVYILFNRWLLASFSTWRFGKSRGGYCHCVSASFSASLPLLLVLGCNYATPIAEDANESGSGTASSADGWTSTNGSSDTIDLVGSDAQDIAIRGDRSLLTHDFGIARPHSVLKHAVGVRNAGHSPLVLDSLSSSCVCTVLKCSSETIAPGATEYFELSLSTKNAKGTVSGSVLAEFRSDNSKNVSVVFKAVASVFSEMSSSVEEISWLVLRGDDPQAQVVDIQNFSDADWCEIKVIESPAWIHVSEISSIKVSRQDSASPRQAWRTTLLVDTPQVNQPAVAGAVRFSTPDSDKECTIKVFYRESAPVTLSTSRLHLGTIQPGDRVQRTIVLNFANATIAKSLIPDGSNPQVSLADTDGLSVEQNWTWIDDKSGILSLAFDARKAPTADARIVDESINLSLSGSVNESISVFARIDSGASSKSIK